MTAETILLLAAVFFTMVAVLGGGFTAKEISVPTVPGPGRIASGGLAVLLFAGAAWLIVTAEQQPLATSGQQPPTTASGETSESSPSATPPAPSVTATVTVSASSAPPTTDAPEPTEPPSPSSTTEASDQETLLSLLPTSVRDFCARSEFGLSELGTRASLECRLPSGVLVDFHWFASSERLEDVFAEDAENADLTAGGDCTAEQWSYRGTWSVGAGNPAVGKLLCFTSGEEARVVWTYDDMSLFAHAVRADGDIGRLHRWWSDVAAATHTL